MGRSQAKSVLGSLSGKRNTDFYTDLYIPPSKISLEHVVPRSRLPPGLIWDIHNLRIVDRDLNSVRSNTRFGNKTIQNVSFCPYKNKGSVSRICAHMFDACKDIDYNMKEDLVIDRLLMLQWDEKYPVTDEEKYMNDHIYFVQGTYNKYVEGEKDIGS